MGPDGGTSSVPGFSLLRWYSNPEPDMLNAVHSYAHSKNIVMALEGDWNLKPDAAGFYSPKFQSDKTKADFTSNKSIKCDQVQAICIYLSGNKLAMHKFLADLPVTEMNRILLKN